MNVTINPVHTSEDIHKLAQLAEGIWNEYFIDIITQEQIDYMIEEFQSEKAIKQQLGTEGFEYFFITVDGTHVGYTGVKQEERALFLSKLYLANESRGKGIASVAIRYLVNLCNQRNLSSIWLTVNRHNHHTIAVYEKKGFKVIREEVKDIGKGFVMDDYIMEKQVQFP
ncbi:GNAT family N-acetyltransferase [Paenibacillus sp. JCM 10914]|uniref:GNAT family N-acetyltransferase n=1 Tax=Paenibacillus sp. JCM 10914 TaxID=1236974 RepID=UPI0003CC56BE|nr:GNAT family N-acetyltransferase [Paenibacillus sp. JCM 10914]GAE04302.1 GCN5-related N-acetyltransferase [Paenibacillus sp. JCM 10914]